MPRPTSAGATSARRLWLRQLAHSHTARRTHRSRQAFIIIIIIITITITITIVVVYLLSEQEIKQGNCRQQTSPVARSST